MPEDQVIYEGALVYSLPTPHREGYAFWEITQGTVLCVVGMPLCYVRCKTENARCCSIKLKADTTLMLM